MNPLAMALKHLIAAGVTGDALVTAINDIEETMRPGRSAGAIRTARYRERGGDRISFEIRQEVLARDNGECQDCGSLDDLQIDHIRPVSKGGETSLENLQVLCRPCNARKKDRVRKRESKVSDKIPINPLESPDKEKAVSSPSPFPPITPYTPTPSSQKELRANARVKERLVLPDWIPKEDWADYLEMRVTAKKAATDAAKKSAIAKLDRLRQNGHDPGAVLQQSTFHNWPGLYEIKENHGTTQQNNGQSFSGGARKSVTEATTDIIAAISRGEF